MNPLSWSTHSNLGTREIYWKMKPLDLINDHITHRGQGYAHHPAEKELKTFMLLKNVPETTLLRNPELGENTALSSQVARHGFMRLQNW